MKPASSRLLTLAASLFTGIYTSPTPPTLNLNQPGTGSNLSTTSLGNPFECWHNAFYDRRRAPWNDCTGAVALLPNLDTHGVFGAGNDPNFDPFSLPRIERSGRCEVSITMADIDSRDESSWEAINIAALKVLEACGRGYASAATTGGETTTGTHSRIKIVVEYVRGGGVLVAAGGGGAVTERVQ